MRRFITTFSFLSIAALAACGGGSGGGGGSPYGAPPPTAMPQPSASSPASGQSNTPITATVGGSAALVDATTGFTLYTLSSDPANSSTCVASNPGCAGNWPPELASAGSQAGGNFTIFSRSDGSGMQWANKTQPLYTFVGDSGPAQANGDGIVAFGGTWHIARP